MLVYFAHPAFNDKQRENASFVKNEALGFIFSTIRAYNASVEILNPFEYSPNIEGDREKKKVLAKTVLDANHRLIDTCDLVLAIIDDRDIGVIYEIGYAVARGIPVITVSMEDYDVNIMLSASVLAHIPRLREESQQKLLRDLLTSQARLVSVEINKSHQLMISRR